MGAISIITWVLFGLMMLGILFGVLWGARRGLKRSLFRLGTFLLAIPLAVLLAPVIASPFGGIKFGGYTISDHLINSMSGEAGYAAADFTQLHAFLTALPIAVLSLVIFIALLYIFRFLTWIGYAIFVNKVAPKQAKAHTGERTANGMAKFEMRDTKQQRWLGALVGFVQGLLIFFLVMIPVNGVITVAGAVVNYEPEFATAEVRVLDEDISPLSDVIEAVDDFNRQFQRSPYGIMTRWTGMQWASGPMFDYITRVRMPSGMQNISLRRDLIKASNVYFDFVAINQARFDSDESWGDFLASPASDPYWDGMTNMADRLFDITLVRLLTDSASGLAEFIREAEILDDDDLPVDKEVLLTDIENMNANTIHSDLLHIIDIARSIFAIWDDISEIIEGDDAIDAIGGLSDATIETFGEILDTITNELLFRMTLRSFIAELLSTAAESSEVLGENTQQVIDDLVEYLNDRNFTDFDWAAELKAIRASIQVIGYISDDYDLRVIIGKVFNRQGDYFAALSGSWFFGPLVVGQINDVMNDVFADDHNGVLITNVMLDQTRGNFANSLEALAILANIMIDTLDILEAGTMDGQDLFDIFGNNDFERQATFGELLGLPDGTIIITLESSIFNGFETALNVLYNNDVSDRLLGPTGIFRQAS